MCGKIWVRRSGHDPAGGQEAALLFTFPCETSSGEKNCIQQHFENYIVLNIFLFRDGNNSNIFWHDIKEKKLL